MHKLVTIHQPEHMPWSGFFHKMMLADHYVYLDNVQYKKNYFHNRNKIIDRNGVVSWLTIPVKFNKNEWTQPFHMVKISPSHPWKDKYLGKIQSCYSKYPFFKEYYPLINEMINSNPKTICELNVNLIHLFREILDIKTPISFASEMSANLTKSDLLLEICKYNNAGTYLSGPSGKEYLDKSIFKNEGIAIKYHEYSPPKYKMNYQVLGLSSLDIIMRFGKEAKAVINSINENE